MGVDGRATLKGNVIVQQGAREIRANEVQYDPKDQSLQTEGHIDYRDPLVHVTGAGGSYSAAGGADFKSAEFALQQRAARGSAEDMKLTPQGVMQLTRVMFTTCPAKDSSWELKASSITLDTRDKLGTGHNASIDFMGVPILYTPYVSFPLGSERKSGFLYPTIGSTSNSGFQLSVPYYFNLAPNYDFTFEPTEYSKRGIDLGGDLRLLTENNRGELNFEYLPYDKLYGAQRNFEHLVDVAELPADFRLTINAANVSDTSYFEDFSTGPEGASTAFLNRQVALSYRDEHWNFVAEAQQFQTIDYTLAPDDRPYARVPRIVADALYTLGPEGVFHYGFNSEFVDFQRGTGVTGWRFDIAPAVSLDFTGPGYFIRPALAWRATEYQLSNLAPGEPAAPVRTLPIASFDTGLVFERDSGSENQHRLTLEPRLLYLYVPYKNQDELPVFDTALPDLNPVELFRTNRYVGADRVSDANQLAVGITSRLLNASDGRQFLAFTFGQAYYFEPPQVTLPGEIPTTQNRSDLVAELVVTAWQHFNASAAVQWDPQNQSSVRSQVNLQYKPSNSAVINLNYRYEATQEVLGQPQPGFQQLEGSLAWPIGHKWNVFLKDVYSFPDHEELERFFGFEYRACCWRVRLGARRYVSNHDGTQSTGIWLQLELAGLASVGSASDASLETEVRGYIPPGAKIPTNEAHLVGVW